MCVRRGWARAFAREIDWCLRVRTDRTCSLPTRRLKRDAHGVCRQQRKRRSPAEFMARLPALLARGFFEAWTAGGGRFIFRMLVKDVDGKTTKGIPWNPWTMTPANPLAYRFRGTKGYLEEPATFCTIHFAIIFYSLSGRL